MYIYIYTHIFSIHTLHRCRVLGFRSRCLELRALLALLFSVVQGSVLLGLSCQRFFSRRNPQLLNTKPSL